MNLFAQVGVLCPYGQEAVMAGSSRLGRFPKGTQHARRWGDEVVQGSDPGQIQVCSGARDGHVNLA